LVTSSQDELDLPDNKISYSLTSRSKVFKYSSYMTDFYKFLGSFDADAGKRGKQFERFVRWFLKHDPQWATQIDEIWLWDDYPNRWGPDCGIDLVFRHKNSEVWAVQAKCYDPKYSITKQDIDKFLSESNRAGIDKRLLIATTDGIGANAKQVCDAQEKQVVRFLLSHFEDSEVEYPVNFADLHKAKLKPKPTSKEHQKEAIEAVTKGFADTDRGQLIMACGTGKTFTTLWIKEALKAESTLILLPSLGLLSQTLHEWTAAKNQDFAVLCVCSDDSVGKKGGDEAVHDIADLAFPVTSDSVEIAKFLNQAGPKVVFSTYQSSNLIADAQVDQKVPAFNLAIADEAHRCAGDKAGNFATILDGQRIRAEKRLFATATPRTYSTALKKGAEERGIEIVGMDNEEVFGQQLYTLIFGEAIKRGLLTDYRVVIVGVDSPMIASYIENREFVKTDSGIEKDAETLAAQVALLKAMKDFDLHRMISFHSRVNRAEGFAKDLIDVAQWLDAKHRPSGELKTDFVSGEMPTSSRRQKLAILKSSKDNERALLTNARCLSEGVDVPSLDGVAFIDPRASQVDIIQAVGRAIRLSPNKKAGTIVLPVFISRGDNPEQSLDEGNFKPIWDVLNALKSHDDVLADELDQMRVGMGKRSSSKVQGGFSKIEFDLPASVDKSFSDSIQTRLVENATAPWDFYYGLLLTYKSQHGHCNVPRSDGNDVQFDLGKWSQHQRSAIRSNKLSKTRLDKLLAIGFDLEPHDSAWNKKFLLLSDFYKKNGHSNVGSRDKNRELARWVVKQRVKFREGKLDQAYIEKLKTLNFEFERLDFDRYAKDQMSYEEARSYVSKLGIASLQEYQKWVRGDTSIYGKPPPDLPRSPQQVFKDNGWIDWPSYLGNSDRNEKNDLLWDEMFDRYKKYVVQGGDNRHISTDDKRLKHWVGTQRSFLRKKLLDPKREIKLREVGFIFDPNSDLWSYAYSYLLKYVQRVRTSYVKQNHKEDGFSLGAWVSRMRNTKDELSEDQIYKLEQLPGWSWDLKIDKWNSYFEALKNHLAKYGTCEISNTYFDVSGLRLSDWIIRQRQSKSKNRLSLDQIQKLESLNNWSWDQAEDKWSIGFEYLKQFANEFNSNSIPKSFDESIGYNLSGWVNEQIDNYKQNKIPSEKIKLLESVNGWVWNKREHRWETGFIELSSYVSENKTSVVPYSFMSKTGFKLGVWVYNVQCRKSATSPDRVKRLEALPDWRWKK